MYICIKVDNETVSELVSVKAMCIRENAYCIELKDGSYMEWPASDCTTLEIRDNSQEGAK